MKRDIVIMLAWNKMLIGICLNTFKGIFIRKGYGFKVTFARRLSRKYFPICLFKSNLSKRYKQKRSDNSTQNVKAN